MRSFPVRLALALSLVAGSASLTLAPSGASASDQSAASTSSYIVTLRTPAGTSARQLPSVTSLATRLVAPYGGDVTHTYGTVFRGFSVRLPAAAAQLLRLDPAVESVTADGTSHTTGIEGNPPWGLDRIDQHRLPLNQHYKYPNRPGKGAHLYVVDTGINPDHQDFAGRVGSSRNFSPDCFLLTCSVDPSAWTDCNGHGTHVASTAAGTRYGVAKKATIHAIRVLDCGGSGEDSDIIAALDWLAQHHASPAVVNMSLGGSSAPALDAAVAGLVQHGIAVAVAAGNDNADACDFSPAAEPSVLTVGATTKTDERSSFSNFGSCVDLFAPGTDITGADYATTNGSAVLSGTSMASPHVAGALALIRAARPGMPAKKAQNLLLSRTTNNRVSSAGAGSTRELLFVVVDNPPRARFGGHCDHLHCVFRAGKSSDDHRIKKIYWRFNHGRRVRGTVVHHAFGKSGKQTVTLVVVDNVGQKTKRTKTIKVHRRG